MSHWSTAPRKGWVIIHHAGSANSHTVYNGSFCASGYDFTIDRDGHIYVCRNNADTFYRWKKNIPAGEVWHASGCDCQAIGIMMHGCFGGCTSGNVAGANENQKCSAGYIMSHLDMPNYDLIRIRPHAACHDWNPCNHSNPKTTQCPGDNYTGPDHAGWNDNGLTLRQQLANKRAIWDQHTCCDPPCPPD